jgi:Carbon-nitrogen hydrolase
MTIVIGFTERADDGSLYNSAAVVSDDAISGVYRKLYPGHSACRPGVELPIFRHAEVPFGVLICNDAHYKEPARVLAARGASLLVVPVHGGHRPDKELALRARGTNVLIARAVENGIPLIAADVAGHQGERISHGTTTIIDSEGTILVAAAELEEDAVVADIDLDGQPRGGPDGELLSLSNPAVTTACSIATSSRFLGTRSCDDLSVPTCSSGWSSCHGDSRPQRCDVPTSSSISCSRSGRERSDCSEPDEGRPVAAHSPRRGALSYSHRAGESGIGNRAALQGDGARHGLGGRSGSAKHVACDART